MINRRLTKPAATGTEPDAKTGKEPMLKVRQLVVGAAVLVAAPLGLFAAAQPAEAAPNGCASGALCVYWDTFYRGGKYQFFYSNSSWGDTVNWAIEDDDSSWFNNGTAGVSSVRVFSGRGYSGSSFCLPRGTGDEIAWVANDRGSSNLWVRGC